MMKPKGTSLDAHRAPKMTRYDSTARGAGKRGSGDLQLLCRFLQHGGGALQPRDLIIAELEPQHRFYAAAVHDRGQAPANIRNTVVVADEARDRQHGSLVANDGFNDAHQS